MIKIGVLGAGHLGKIHIKLIKQISEYSLVGFYDPDPEKCKEAEVLYEIPSFNTPEDLIEASDVVDIVTPTLSHFKMAQKAIAAGKHFFVEKPITNTTGEAEELMRLLNDTKLKAQVGHVERFNPAFIAAKSETVLSPMFIEAHRLAEFNPRGTDVPVVLDLMIHDIDIVLSLVKSEVVKVNASGVPVISDTPDIANARIEFANGCVANLTTSRVSLKKMRKMRLFQKNAYITLDFLNKNVSILRITDLEEGDNGNGYVLDAGEGKPKKDISFSNPKVAETNAIQLELQEFAYSILNNTSPAVTLEDGYRSLKLAHRILEEIENSKLQHYV